MQESQYKIPYQEVLQNGGELRESERVTVERSFQDVTASIDMLRAEALATPYTQKNILGRAATRVGVSLGSLGERKTQYTLAQLVENESVVGGTLFYEGAKFWLQPPVAGDVSGVRDWYFTPHIEYAAETLWYKTGPSGVEKLYHGVNCAFSEGELERFTQAVTAYHQAVAMRVYQKPAPDYTLAA